MQYLYLYILLPQYIWYTSKLYELYNICGPVPRIPLTWGNIQGNSLAAIFIYYATMHTEGHQLVKQVKQTSSSELLWQN